MRQDIAYPPILVSYILRADVRSERRRFSRGQGYFEVDVDVSSSSVAANIVGLVQGLTKGLCVDMAICLEGHTPEELPESLLGTVRCSHLDLGTAKLLDVNTGKQSSCRQLLIATIPSVIIRI